VHLARALAVCDGRDFVTPDDIRQLGVPVLGHRVVTSDNAWARGIRGDEIVRAVMESVAAPSWR
jgi:MoxR-like ATPase